VFYVLSFMLYDLYMADPTKESPIKSSDPLGGCLDFVIMLAILVGWWMK